MNENEWLMSERQSNSWGLFQLGVKQEKICLSQKLKQEFVTFMPSNKEVKINNIKPFPLNWT